LVRGIEAGSPADKAGLEPGDIITRFDGKAIDKAADLPRMVGGTKPGTRSNLTVFRRGANKDLAITVAELEPAKTSKPAAPAEESKTAGTAQSMGLVVTDLTEAQKKEFKRGGVRVESTAEASARAGLREGDVILQIGNTEIAQLRDFETAMAKLDKSKPFNILFRRGEVVQFAVVRPGR
jgi:serine protease Do